MILIQT